MAPLVSLSSPGAGRPGGVIDEPPLWAVGQLVAAVADALRARFNPVRVVGELAGYNLAASGHAYFTLKDGDGQLRCAFFRRAAASSPVALSDGMRVEVLGRLDVYAPRGDLQLIVERVRPAGQGSLYEQFLRLKATLAAEGWFDAQRKRPLPAWPRGIGVVTSLNAAALRDVATTLARRAPHVPVWVYPAAVQGAEAPGQLCAALQQAYAQYEQEGVPDVLLVVRGGGSLEDLWAFNDPALVRLLGRSPMPVISGVGHETDITLTDLVADVRAATPTAAAELCAPARTALLGALAQQQQRAVFAVWRRLETEAQRLDRLVQRLGRPSTRVAQERQRLLALEHQWRQAVQRQLAQRRQILQRWSAVPWHAVQRQLERQRQALQPWSLRWTHALQRRLEREALRLQRWQGQLQLLDPQRVLQRGYALVTDVQGHVVTNANAVSVGTTLHVALAHGRLQVRTERADPGP
jgi:exodeoxyribonuclease VII large subunit